MPGCKIDRDSSPDFKKLIDSYRQGYPHIESDLSDAFSEIEKNILANRGRRVFGGQQFDIYKYRQNSKDIKRGARYGWRIYCLLDRLSGIMYPIITYPKTIFDDADTKTIKDAVANIKLLLGQCTRSECDGALEPSYPQEIASIGGVPHIKLRCCKCRTCAWREEPLSLPATT